jgi:DNA-binding transcriptional regulator YiaG
METKVMKRHIDELLGFPVQLSNVTFVKVRGEWLPKINYQRLDLQVAKVLCHLHRPLRGAELRFVRLFLGLTQASLAERFGVSHVAVHKWERRRAKPSGMPWPTEKDLRLMIQSHLSDDPVAVGRLYGELKERPEPEAKDPACLKI